MNASPVLVSGLGELAGSYDALICDVWGVVHDGMHAHPPAIDALLRFRKERGRVVLLSNAPRPPDGVQETLRNFGVPDEAYDAIVTSGGSSREDLAARAANGRIKLLHIGPSRDEPVYAGLDIALAGPEDADVVLCTGLYEDDHETPDDYADMLRQLKARGLTMICANPDLLVPRGGVLVHCAGGVARAYEKIGGEVIWYGKPKAPIYHETIAAAGGPGTRILVVGDGLETDMAGANLMGLDALFVALGLHRDEIGTFSRETVAALFNRHGLTARAAVDVFKW